MLLAVISKLEVMETRRLKGFDVANKETPTTGEIWSRNDMINRVFGLVGASRFVNLSRSISTVLPEHRGVFRSWKGCTQCILIEALDSYHHWLMNLVSYTDISLTSGLSLIHKYSSLFKKHPGRTLRCQDCMIVREFYP